jgi:hypothetical protein
MFIDNKDKESLLAKIKVAGIEVKSKQVDEFKKHGTVVVAANKAKKKKLDKVLEVAGEAAFVEVSEFDDNMWRLTDAAVFDTLGTVARGKEFQDD